jgi:HEAT repeat protein
MRLANQRFNAAAATLLCLASILAAALAPEARAQDDTPWEEIVLGFRDEFRPDLAAPERIRAVERLATVDRLESAAMLLPALRAVQNTVEDLTLALGEKTHELEPYRKDALTRTQWAERDRLEAERLEIGRRLDAEKDVEDAIRIALARLRNPQAVEWVARTGLADESFLVRAACAEALGSIGLPATYPRLIAAASDPDPRVRTAAIEALGELRVTEAVEAMIGGLDDEQVPVRATAVRALGTLGGKEAIDALVRAMQRESGRLLLDIGRTLEKLTGQTFRDNPPAWRDWWEANSESFGAEPLIAVKKEPGRRSSSSDENAPTLTYHGITTTSSRIVFILDISDSMNDPARTQYLDSSGKTQRGTSERSKFEVAREELKRAIRALDGKDYFNIVVYNHEVRKWQDRMVAALPSNKALAIAFLDSLKAVGGTNIFDALETAFTLGGFGVQDRYYRSEVDTLFLLSDGAPSAGRITDTDEILEEVGRINRLRKLQIHAIAVGLLADKDFLRKLAHQNDGQFIEAL